MEFVNIGQYKGSRSAGWLLDEIKVIKDNYGVHGVAITETWCTSSKPDAVGVQHLPEGQTRWPPTRGIASYVRDSIPTENWPELNQHDLESLWITIRPPKMPRDHPQVTIRTMLQS